MKNFILKNLEFFITGMVMGWAMIIGLAGGEKMLADMPGIKSFQFFIIFALIGFFILATDLVLIELMLRSIIPQKSIYEIILCGLFIILLGIATGFLFIGLLVLVKNSYVYFWIISFLLSLFSYYTWRREKSIIPASVFAAGVILVVVIAAKNENIAYSIILLCGYCLGIIGYFFKKAPKKPKL